MRYFTIIINTGYKPTQKRFYVNFQISYGGSLLQQANISKRKKVSFKIAHKLSAFCLQNQKQVILARISRA